jgi:hypothetical protein
LTLWLVGIGARKELGADLLGQTLIRNPTQMERRYALKQRERAAMTALILHFARLELTHYSLF